MKRRTFVAALSMVAGLSACAGKCVATATDPSNCGKCGQACKATETCTASVCVAIVHAASNTIVYRTAPRTLQFRGRQTTLGVCLRIADFTVSETGVYFVEPYCNDRFMDDRTLHITVSDEDES